MQRQFTAAEWSYNSSIYEVNVRQYTQEGTFKAFAKHLPRLRDMGINILWFMPVTPISLEVRQGTLGSYYACSDYTAINPEFGTLADFTSLVQEAHAMGFKVIIDWVANHTGWGHVWTKTHPEYFLKDATGKFYDNNNWHDVIDLNYYDHNMRNAMIDAMGFWIKNCDIDGFRCDMAHLVPLDFWKQARTELDTLKSLFWLGETQDLPYLQVFDCCYTWDWMGWTEKFCKHEADMVKLKWILNHFEADFPAGTMRLFFTSNHDENTWNGTEFEKYGDACKPLAVFSSTWKGLPLIYSGQELPNRKRLKFFDKDTIDWGVAPELHDFYKTLLQLRQSHPALSAAEDADARLIETSDNEHVMAFVRSVPGNRLLVFLNFSSQPLSIKCNNPEWQGEYKEVFTDKQLSLHPTTLLNLDPWGWLVLDGQ